MACQRHPYIENLLTLWYIKKIIKDKIVWSSHGCSFTRLITNCSLSNFCNYLILSSFVPLFLSLMYSVFLSFFIPLPFLSSSIFPHISLTASFHLPLFNFSNADYLVTTYFDDQWFFHLKINRSKPYVCMCVSICVFMHVKKKEKEIKVKKKERNAGTKCSC